jgi:Bax protein
MAMREAEGRLSGIRLADGLAGYSERGTAYVAEIKAMIRQNGLEP